MLKKSFAFIFTILVLTACEVSVDPSDEVIREDAEEENSNWSTYTSEEYGFSLEFSKTWTVEEDSQGRPYISFISPERADLANEVEGDQMIRIDAQIKIYEGPENLPNNDNSLSFETWIETENTYFDGEPMKTTVDGYSGYSMESKGFANIESEFIMLEHEGRIYELNFNVPDANDYIEEREHMLDSFQFLTSSTDETSSTSSRSCDEEACFMENFKTCEAATFSSDLGFAAVTYEILGSRDTACEVSMVYTKNPNPAWVDQPISCTLNTEVDFLTAFQEEFEAAVEGKGNCTGPLTEVLQDL